MVAYLKRLLVPLLAYIPSRLPDTPNSHEDWAGSIVQLAGYPDDPSYRHSLATTVLHFNGRYRVSKQEMVNHLKEAIAKQTAYMAIQAINAAEKAKSEVTAKEVASNEQHFEDEGPKAS